MKVAFFSDLHLDFIKAKYWPLMLDRIVQQAESVDLLVNAGDNANDIDSAASFYIEKRINDTNIPYVRVMGNHDFYNRSGWENEDVSLFSHSDKIVAATTLWTDCHDDPLVKWYFQRNMNDGSCIDDFDVDRMCSLHKKLRVQIFESKPEIVVTHNPPSLLSVGPKFVTEHIANRAFIPDLSNQILDSGIKLWICGHVHHKHEYMLGDTKVVCNPFGYPGEIYKRIEDFNLGVVEI